MDQNISDVLLTTDGKSLLKGAAQWARIVGTVGMVMSALILFFALFILFGYSALTSLLADNDLGEGSLFMQQGIGIMMGLMYLCMAAVYFIVSWWLFKFGKGSKIALQLNQSEALTSALGNLKKFFMAIGIFSLLSLGMVALIVVFIMIGSLLS